MLNSITWHTLFSESNLEQEIRIVMHKIEVLKNTGATIYPFELNVFKAFELCEFDKLSVVILGQDPYHGDGQAHGLSFSVPEGQALPPSLRNIFKELYDDLHIPISKNGNLESWAKQGVLLLNSILTVERNKPGSHRNIGWEKITDQVIQLISQRKENLVFILWGNFAINKLRLIDQSKHLVLTAAHPSPLSAYKGFFGCRHFSKANAYLKRHNKPIISW